ncbi:MAG: rRNA maturation RNase YbeY [Geminicoccaceae bacterium]
MDSDGRATVALTVTTAGWRAAIDDLEGRCLGIVEATLARATDEAWVRRGEVSLLLADDGEIQRLNSRYRQREKPTNVLSFPSMDLQRGRALVQEPRGPVMLGDIAMSFERLSEEAKRDEKPVLDHFAHLLVHGTLHLVGYDHENDEQADLMEGLEAAVLEGLGMAAPYPVGDGAVPSGVSP